MKTHHVIPVALRFLHRAAVLFLLFAVSLPAWSASAQLDREKVLKIDSKVTIRKDGSLLVHEVIDVNVLGLQIQNSIVRAFAPDSQRPAPNITVQEVKMDEKPAPFHVEDVGSVRRIVIGDPEQPLLTGRHTFTLVYETSPLVLSADGRDHFNWNVTGWNWTVPIDDVIATIELPKGTPFGELVVGGSTGGDGSRNKRYSFDFDTPGAVAFSAEALAPKEGLSVSLDWPGGYIRHKTWGVPVALMENPGTFVALLGLGILLLYWGVLWFFFGRAPKLARQIPRTEPPAGVSAVGMRYLKLRSADAKSFTVLLLALGRSGVATIEESNEGYTVRRTSADFHSLAPEEREFAKALFGTHDSVSLKSSSPAIGKAQRALRKALANSYSKAFAPVTAFAWPALIVSSLAVITSLYLEVRSNLAEEFLSAFLLTLVFLVCVILLRHIWPSSLKDWKVRPEELHVPGAAGTGVSAQKWTAILLLVMLVGVFVMLATKVSFLWTFVMAVQAAVNLWFMKIMHVPTARGHRLMDDTEGFKFHLRKLAAESTFNAEFGDERQRVFGEYLDYAMAFDLEKEWARRTDVGGDEPPYCPTWYTGENFRLFYLRRSPSAVGATPGLEGLENIAGGRFISR